MTTWRPPGILTGVFILALAIQIFVGVVSYRTTGRLTEQSRNVRHTFEVLSNLGSLWAQIAEVDASARGFMLAGEEQFLEPYNASLSEIAKEVTSLRKLTADNPRQQQRLDNLEPLISKRLAIIKERIEMRRTKGLAAVSQASRAGHGQTILVEIRKVIREIETEENDLLNGREASARSAANAAVVTAIVGTSLSMSLLLGVFFLLNREVRQRQQAVEEQRRALRLVDATLDGVFMFDHETLRFFYVNQGAMEQTGYSRKELLTMTPLDIKPEFDPPGFQRMLAPLLAGTSQSHTFTTVHRRKDGRDVPVEIVLQCVDLDSGNRNMMAIARDVTERRRLEEERDRFFTLSRDMICIAGFGGYFKRLNPAWEKTLGFTTEEMMAVPYLSFVHPDDHEATSAEAVKLAIGLETISFENRYRCKDGSYKQILWSCTPSVGDQLIYAVARDITERKRAEEALLFNQQRLAGMVDSAMDAVITVDAAQGIVLFNRAAEEMFRCKASEALGQPIEHFIPERFRDRHREHVREFAATGVTSRTMAMLGNVNGRRTDGEEFPIEASISQIKVGGARLFTVILRDITQRKRDEEAVRNARDLLEQRTAQLEATNKELEAFTYSVAHDLRAPLRQIDGFAQILTEENSSTLSEETRRYLARICEGTRRMGQLVDDLLNLARVGRQEVRSQVTGLGSVVAEVLRELEREKSGRAIEWKIQPLPFVDCDPALMKQVFANLLSNAVKFTSPRAQAVIELGTLSQNGHPVVYVRDNGVGFNMKYSDKLFGVFQRLHRQEDFEGTGVGLATVQRIIHKHGGQVWAEAELDKGATFYFTLANSASLPSATQEITKGGKS